MQPRLEIVKPPAPAEIQGCQDTLTLARVLISEGQVLPAKELTNGWTVSALLPEEEGIRLGVVFERTGFDYGDRIEIERVPHGVRVVTTMLRPIPSGREERTFTSVMTREGEEHSGRYQLADKDFFGLWNQGDSGTLSGRRLSTVHSELSQLKKLLHEPVQPARPRFMRRLWSRIFSA